MARTLATMVNRISRELRRDGLTADIRDSIVDAISNEKENRFWFMERTASATLSTGVDSLSLPTGFIEMDSIYIADDSNKYTLTPVPFSEIDLYETDNNSTPDWYAIYGDKIRLYPPSDRVYNVRYSYVSELTAVSASSTGTLTNSWLEEGEELIRLSAKAKIFFNRLRNAKEGGIMRGLADSVRRTLRSKTSTRVSKDTTEPYL